MGLIRFDALAKLLHLAGFDPGCWSCWCVQGRRGWHLDIGMVVPNPKSIEVITGHAPPGSVFLIVKKMLHVGLEDLDEGPLGLREVLGFRQHLDLPPVGCHR